MTSLLRAVWADPAPPVPRARTAWDPVLVVGFMAVGLFEALVRPGIPLPVVVAVIGLVPTLFWRRTHPAAVAVVAYVAMTLVTLAADDGGDMYTTVYMLLLLHALARWGSGRAALLGSSGAVLHGVVLALAGRETVGDAVGGAAVLAVAITVGLAGRFRARARARALSEVRLRERERLARDLHDTVAHHVSAIAVRAQAGVATARTDPDAAVQALEVIAAEASRTLAEMRTIVHVLRVDEAQQPVPRLADVVRLDDGAPGPPVAVRLAGDVDSVEPAVGAAAFRVAQEAVTNARRHARNATRVDVDVTVDERAVRLRVADDGDPVPPGAVGSGYGLTGMRERADLLGGTCTAQPGPGRGWLVTAELPRVAR